MFPFWPIDYCSSGLSRNLQLQTCAHSTRSHTRNVCRLPLTALFKYGHKFILVAAYFLDGNHIWVLMVLKGAFSHILYLFSVAYVFVFVDMWMGHARRTDTVSAAFLSCPPPFPLKQNLSWLWSSLIPVGEPAGSRHPLSPGLAPQECTAVPGLLEGARDLNSGPHACKADAHSTEPSSQAPP